MKDVMGIINLSEKDDMVQSITIHRPLASIPFGGRYRVIDFVLSNMVNSGIQNVGILTQDKHRSLIDHLRSGKEWDLDRRRDGLFVFPPDNFSSFPFIYKGVLQNLYNNLDYIYRSRQKYVLMTGSSIIYNFDYRKLLDFHLKNNADITLLFKQFDNIKSNNCRGTLINEINNGRIFDMEVEPVTTKSNKMALETYIMEKSLLIDLVDACVSRGYFDFIKDGIVKNIGMLNVFGYSHDGYVAMINSISSYFKHSMDLLKQDIWQQLFFNPGLIYTKVKDGVATKYSSNSKVKNSLIANGCLIDGIVENSILFRGVKVNKDAHVKNSIIMQKSEINTKALVENVITDKEVIITAGKILKGDTNYPVVIEKKRVV